MRRMVLRGNGVFLVPSTGVSIPAIERPADWARLVLGLVLVFGLFHGLAMMLGSDRGQRGVLIAFLVVTATAAVDRFLLPRNAGSVIQHLGLGRPSTTGLIVAAVPAFLLLVAAFVFMRVSRVTPSFYPGWISLLPGLFAQGGIAEEVLFRGYLFGRARVGRTFWRAAAASMVPFVAVHLVMFGSTPWPIALASVLLSIIISFPLAHLFELGGDTIWGPAVLHFVIQGTPKVLVVSEGGESFALLWIAAGALVPLLVFTVRRPARA